MEETKGEDNPAKTLIDEARELREQILKSVDEMKLLLARQEQIKASELLGGNSESSIPSPEIDPEKKKKDEINKLLAGTGMSI